MAEIQSMAVVRFALGSDRSERIQSWHRALPQILILVALGVVSAATAVAYPLLFTGVFSAL